MKRVVVTGMGIVSPIGNSAQEVLASLREAKSGIVKADTYAELGFRCQVHGAPKLDWETMIDRNETIVGVDMNRAAARCRNINVPRAFMCRGDPGSRTHRPPARPELARFVAEAVPQQLYRQRQIAPAAKPQIVGEIGRNTGRS